MRTNKLKATLKAAIRTASILPFAAVIAFGQQQINLTAGPTSITLPDGSVVPMWGYSCGAAAAGSTATCANLNPSAPAATLTTPAGWSPVVITVPTGQALQINLTNSLSFTAGAGTNTVPTSLVIVGQLGGGLGGTPTKTDSPDHTNAQPLTWPIAGTPPGVPPVGVGTPPPQGQRVQSFATEVAFGTTATALTWTAPRPGTYLLESGTHPSIQGPMGLYGMVVVTTAPAGATAGTAYPAVGANPAVAYNAEIPLLLSEIDPVQNNGVQAAVNTVGFTETAVWSGQSGGCGNPSSTTYHTCYPPAVNYTPLYYLINGVAFNKTSAATSMFSAAPATGVTGNVLVRLVNAGLRMHVPSIVGSQTGVAVAPAVPPSGFTLIAEDGNPLPGAPRVQSEVFMAAGKTYDVMINAPATAGAALPIFDRQLSLSGNAVGRDAGMLAYIGINGATLPVSPAFAAAVARPDSYPSLAACAATPCPGLTVSDPGKGLLANDTNVYGVTLLTAPTHGTLTLNANGTFTYVPSAAAVADTFTYCANGSVTAAVCSSGITASVGLGVATLGGPPVVAPITYTSNVASSLSIKSPGVLSVDSDPKGYPLAVAFSTGNAPVPSAGLTLSVDKSGGFNATVPTCTATAGCTYTFTYKAQNSMGQISASAATVTLNFPAASGLAVTVKDGKTGVAVTDYRWIIEEDRTFYINPNCTTNPPPAGCPTAPSGLVPTFGTNFHTSFMPVVATGCLGTIACESGQTVFDPTSGAHVNAVCDVGNGGCRPGAQQTALDPSAVHLDPAKRYYISVLPGDGANPFNSGNTIPGHTMGGAPIAAACIPVPPATTCTGTRSAVTVFVEPTPLQTAKLSVFVFEDDFPLNGEHDAGGGIDILATNEPGLGHFNITLFDDAGGTGDATGQMTYDMFNMPLSNSLAGMIDPATGQDACPIAQQATSDSTQAGITGMIVTCPKYEADGTTLSPLAGQVVVANLMPGRYGVVATPGADRIAKGEEWLQTNTLDGQKAHDSFLRVGEPSYFQEYGPAGYHVAIGFANPAIVNSRLAGVCAGTDLNITGTNCTNTVTGMVTTERMSRTPDERLYSSGSNDSFAFTQCYVSFGDPDGEDFAFTKCAADGTFTLSGLPVGDWRITVFDQWNDMLVDGLSTPVRLAGGTTNLGQIAINQWQANIYTKTFFDVNGDGVAQDNEPGLTLVPTNIRFRDGSYSNFNNTDLGGNAGFNEIFPLFSWYVIETDSTRYKSTGTHVVYDAGGPADGTCTPATAPCGSSAIGHFMANTAEPAAVTLPAALRVPGAVYCANADCTGSSIKTGPVVGGSSGSGGSTGRIDPPWVVAEGWQGFSGQNSFLEFGKTPYVPGETGGIRGHVVYASTRPFDDPQLLLQLSWEPLVPGVTINLYQESTDAGTGVQTLKLVDTTKTTSWDDWAQGFRSDGIPNMNCPGQLPAPTSTAPGDIFFFTLFNQPMYLDVYNNGITAARALPNNSRFKCYDGMHNWNQLQPAPYDGMYQFPSVTSISPTTGKPTGTNCTICVPNPDTTDVYRSGTPMLPSGKYVVEVVVPPGYELVKEEDKNILIGDNYVAPVTQQFGGLGSIFIMPDQAAIGATYNAHNAQNPTTDLGAVPRHEGDTGSVESFWPCVGQARIVPDYISLFPQSNEVSPFAGATRNLCDRKEVMLDDQTSALAKFYIFTSTHAAAHYTGVITDDFTSEFDPFSPQFGEKFSPANLPVSIKNFDGIEIARTYTDQWGTYDGLNYSTWEVNPPNPTGYAPTMMVTCMNDKGPILDTRAGSPTNGQMITDPLYNPSYSQFCYEIPFMPGQTQYMDTPVVPTSAFAGAGYNNPDCAYPDATPAVKEVDGDGIGPWVSASGHTLTITALGDQLVNNYGYAGPSASTAPYNQKTITRHYGFGATAGTVTIGGVAATVGGWSDTQITVTVPSGVPTCAVQQQQQYGGPVPGQPARCGELIITAANGKQSIDAVTVTIGGKAPTHVAASGSIQTAIDAASPGDLIMIDPTCTTATGPVACTTAGATRTPAAHTELLLMWKPVRLQGAGAASSIIDGSTHPAGKLDPWRRQVNCLFGLALNGQPFTAGTGTNPYDSTGQFSCPGTGWVAYKGGPNNPQVDRVPREGILGWDATLNGNLAELLQEPSLMGAYEGAAITVLSKGVRIPANATDIFGSGAEADFPTGTTLLTNSNRDCGTGNGGGANANPFPSNFQCNPSSIDGLGVTDSSQGGGGIMVHGWGHNLEIANNRVYNNAGTLSGGISVGQGESTDAYIVGGTIVDPGSCRTSNTTNVQLPFCLYTNVNVHNNSVTNNSSTGDELFTATPGGAGGVTFCTGADFYKFNYNWVCGNLSTGDGGGLAHLGFIWNGDIEHNTFLFNQSTNPTIPANGGAMVIMGTPPDGFDANGLECGSVTDADCVPGLSDGTGPGLVINANLIMGNAAESGSGGGIRFQAVNGTEVSRFPSTPAQWYSVLATNNIIANNVAGWDGAGVALEDSLAVNLINNTIMSNDSTASSGVLFNTLGAPLASGQSPPPTCTSNCGTTSAPQPAGLVAQKNSPQLITSFTGPITCPAGHPNCATVSYPLLANNVFWQNRSFYIGVGSLGSGTINQQNVVALYNAFTSNQATSQTSTGQCVSGTSYWDIGVRGDTGPSNHGSGITLAPTYSVLTDFADYSGAALHNTGSNPAVVRQYCNGSRVPPEFQSGGYQVPPGISDATVPNPIFNLTPAATVDEGNNWINISWGPLSTVSPVTLATLGNYAPAAGSPVINYIPNSATTNFSEAPALDFFGTARKTNNAVDAGAVEFAAGAATAVASVTGGPLAFGNIGVGTTSAAQTLTLHNTGTANVTGITLAFSSPRYSRPAGAAGGTCGATLTPAAGTCTINVVFSPTGTGVVNATLTITANVAVSGSPVSLSGTGVTGTAGATLTPATWTPTQTRNCPGTGVLGILACSLDPAQVFTLTNPSTSTATLTGITQATLTGTNVADFTIVRALSTCGPTGNGQLIANTTLAPGASCVITVQFKPLTAEAAGTKTATVSVTDSVGTQSSTITGRAN